MEIKNLNMNNPIDLILKANNMNGNLFLGGSRSI